VSTQVAALTPAHVIVLFRSIEFGTIDKAFACNSATEGKINENVILQRSIKAPIFEGMIATTQEHLRIRGEPHTRRRPRLQDVNGPQFTSFRVLRLMSLLIVVLTTVGANESSPISPTPLDDARDNNNTNRKSSPIDDLRIERLLEDEIGSGDPLTKSFIDSEYPSRSPTEAPSVPSGSDPVSPQSSEETQQPTGESVLTLEPTFGVVSSEPIGGFVEEWPIVKLTIVKPTDEDELDDELEELGGEETRWPATIVVSEMPSEPPSEPPIPEPSEDTPEPTVSDVEVTFDPTVSPTEEATPEPTEATDDDGFSSPPTLQLSLEPSVALDVLTLIPDPTDLPTAVIVAFPSAVPSDAPSVESPEPTDSEIEDTQEPTLEPTDFFNAPVGQITQEPSIALDVLTLIPNPTELPPAVTVSNPSAIPSEAPSVASPEPTDPEDSTSKPTAEPTVVIDAPVGQLTPEPSPARVVYSLQPDPREFPLTLIPSENPSSTPSEAARVESPRPTLLAIEVTEIPTVPSTFEPADTEDDDFFSTPVGQLTLEPSIAVGMLTSVPDSTDEPSASENPTTPDGTPNAPPASRPVSEPTISPVASVPGPVPAPSSVPEPVEGPTPRPTLAEIPTTVDDDDGFEPLTLEPNADDDDDDDFMPVSELTPGPTTEADGRQSLTMTPGTMESDSPSANPSEAPSPVSVVQPTSPPVAPSSPTAPPEPEPTLPSTPAPSESAPTDPLPSPSEPPVTSPSSPPVTSPTSPPVTSPTPPPVTSPTPPPVTSPTPPPATSPTPPPATSPTPPPATSPTPPPATSPTPPPATSPTPPPATAPTPPPATAPTSAPRPTLVPTVGVPVPSAQPSLTLSQDPTPTGTLEPTLVRSVQPSLAPTKSVAPSATPSGAPSLPLQNHLVEAQMAMFPFPATEKLQGRDPIIWESVTDQFLTDYIYSLGFDPPLFDLDLATNIDEQIPAGRESEEEDAAQDESSTRRYLQDSGSDVPTDALTIVFDVVISYRSPSTDIDVKQLVYNAWESSIARAEFLMNLQDQSATFDPVQDVDVIVEGYVPPQPTPSPTAQEDKVNIAVIAGASVGGVALVILIALVVMKRRSGKNGLEMENDESRGTPSTGQNLKVSTEILVEPQDDVSTLGDPMFGQGGMMMGDMDKDEVTAR
jgi:hypothetical protein